MTFSDLAGLGWSSFFASSFESLHLDALTPARVVRAERERYLLMHQGGLCPAVLAGRLRHDARDASDLPVVGDWVVMWAAGACAPVCDASGTDAGPQPGTARIETILPRRTLLTRLRRGCCMDHRKVRKFQTDEHHAPFFRQKAP